MAPKKAAIDSTAEFERAVKTAREAKYVLKLYIAGISVRSSAALRTVTALCEDYLKDLYELEVIDIYKNPTLAKGEQIIAAPTLIKQLPQPLRRIIGDMANKERLLIGLDVRPKK